jgi:hypothetical protein
MQKIAGWSETVKVLWDRVKDTEQVPVRVLLLGSSSLLNQEGLTESLAGRFLLNVRSDGALWGRLVENAVGGYLLDTLNPNQFELSYFRDRVRGKDLEVGYAIRGGEDLFGIEVATCEVHTRKGIEHFLQRYPKVFSLRRMRSSQLNKCLSSLTAYSISVILYTW